MSREHKSCQYQPPAQSDMRRESCANADKISPTARARCPAVSAN